LKMSLKRRKGVKAISALLLFSIAQIGVQVSFAEPNNATPMPPQAPQFIARLRTKNNGPITVNGATAATGASILTNATIETDAVQSATVDLGPLGSLDIAPNTKLILTYDEQGNVKVTIVQGCAILKTKKKTNGEVATQSGTSAGKTNPATGGVLDVCFPPGATGPVVNQGAAASAGAGAGAGQAAGAAAAGGGGLFGLGVPATVAIIAGGAAAALAPVAFQSNPSP
jgi:hypothetical protein